MNMRCLFKVAVCLLVLIRNVYNKDSIVNTRRADRSHPATDFSRHVLVKPRIYHGIEEREISSTKEKDGNHVSQILIMLEVDGKTLELDLSLNQDIFSPELSQYFQHNGSHRIYKPQNDELCHYTGKVRNVPNSWVALSTCGGLSGIIVDRREIHYIENRGILEPNQKYTHFLYKQSDLVHNDKTHGAEMYQHHKYTNIDRNKRNIEHDVLRGPNKANNETKYIKLLLVVDTSEYNYLEKDQTQIVQYCVSLANIINALYKPLNIVIVLQGIIIWRDRDEAVMSSNSAQTLHNFCQYKLEELLQYYPNTVAQLLRKSPFNARTYGRSYIGTICEDRGTDGGPCGVISDHSTVIGLVAETFAHELGHTLGMNHDTENCKCPEEQCIMAATSGGHMKLHWSTCSVDYLKNASSHGMYGCLEHKPVTLYQDPVCGNGFVESGEECDCGLFEHCDNECCNGATCMLHWKAACATGTCCDLSTCQPIAAGTMCRSSNNDCDLPEYCTGDSEYCPRDNYKMDTQPCNDETAYCYRGSCKTRTDQCKLLWGETAKSNDETCYSQNTMGTEDGNCGIFKHRFSKCSERDILCGMLHCHHDAEFMYDPSYKYVLTTNITSDCHAVIYGTRADGENPGLTPNGAPCGDGKMCINKTCMAVESLRQNLTCPYNCNGRGWCNNLGHCHCHDGFAPPYCEFAGSGGSEDSGPTSDPYRLKTYIRVLFIVFFGTIPATAIAAFCLIRAKRTNLCRSHKKNPPPVDAIQSTRRTSFTNMTYFEEAENNHQPVPQDGTGLPETHLNSDFLEKCKGFTISLITNEPLPAPSILGNELQQPHSSTILNKPELPPFKSTSSARWSEC